MIIAALNGIIPVRNQTEITEILISVKNFDAPEKYLHKVTRTPQEHSCMNEYPFHLCWDSGSYDTSAHRLPYDECRHQYSTQDEASKRQDHEA